MGRCPHRPEKSRIYNAADVGISPYHHRNGRGNASPFQIYLIPVLEFLHKKSGEKPRKIILYDIDKICDM